jgi:hypothetical protein
VPGADSFQASDRGRVSLALKLLYGVGEIALTTKMALFGLFILFFYNSVLGVPALWVGMRALSGSLGMRSSIPTSGTAPIRARAPSVEGTRSCWRGP